jgi:peptidoglycan/LPS O-acetylase OafA/YrhL
MLLSEHIAHPRNNAFMLIRLLAAIAVLVTHAYFFAVGEGTPDFLYRLTSHQVDLSYLALTTFFLLSGILVTQSLHQSATLKDYIVKRVARIYPAFIVVILLTTFLLGPIYTSLSTAAYFKHWMTYRYLAGSSIFALYYWLPEVFNNQEVNGSLWSVNVEVKFYLMLLVFAWLGLHKKKWFIAALLIVQLIIVFFFSQSLHDFIQTKTGYDIKMYAYNELMAYFLGGSLLYLLATKIKVKLWWLYAAFLFAVLLLFSKTFQYANFFAVVMFVVAAATNPFCIWLSQKIKNDYSYGLYLYAYPLQWCIKTQLPSLHNPLVFALLSFIVVLPFAMASWHWVEKPILKSVKKVD